MAVTACGDQPEQTARRRFESAWQLYPDRQQPSRSHPQGHCGSQLFNQLSFSAIDAPWLRVGAVYRCQDDLHWQENHFFCGFLKGIFTLKIEELIGVECLKAILEYKGKILLEFDFPDDMETGRVHMELDSDNARKVAQFLLQAADGIDGVINHTLN